MSRPIAANVRTWLAEPLEDDVRAAIERLARADDVRQVVVEALPHLAPAGVVVDHTNTSAVVALEMAQLAAKGGRAFVDAPVSGGQAGAENGQLTIMCGAEAGAFAKIEPVRAQRWY